MQQVLITRLLSIVRKQMQHLLAQQTQLTTQITHIEEAIKNLDKELNQEQHLLFSIIMSGTSSQGMPIYDYAPYLKNMEARQHQLQQALAHHQEILAQVQLQLQQHYQQEQQHLWLLAQYQQQQNDLERKLIQQDMDDHARRYSYTGHA